MRVAEAGMQATQAGSKAARRGAVADKLAIAASLALEVTGSCMREP